jgi:hypothetical protein
MDEATNNQYAMLLHKLEFKKALAKGRALPASPLGAGVLDELICKFGGLWQN